MGERIPIGIIYRNGRPSYEEACGLMKERPLVEQETSPLKVKAVFKEFL